MYMKELCMLMALLLAGGTLMSCGTVEKPSNTDTTAGESTKAPVSVSELEKLPVGDYGGYTFNILLNDQDDRYVDVLTADEMAGDLLNDIVFKRNIAVEQKYNIIFKCAKDDYNKVVQTLQQEVMAGTEAYDLYFANCYASKLAPEGYLYELGVLPNLDLSNPWWDAAALEGLSVQGKSYFVTGDISPTSLMTSSCLVFNKSLFDDSQMEYPYALASEGKWTIDKLKTMTADLSRDFNNDSAYTLGDDLFGFSSWMCDSPYSLYFGSGGVFSVKNADDVPEVKWDMDKMTNVYNNIYDIIVTNESYFVTDAAKYETTYKCFSDSKAYFCEITLQKIGIFLRDMKDDFGILPIPKLNEQQKDYLSCVNGAGGLVVVPANASDSKRTGMILEALGAGAYDDITPTIYEVITKTKNVRDEESSDMVNLIIRNRVFDPFYINLLTGYTMIQDMLTSKDENLASTAASKLTAAESAMKMLVEAYEKSK